MKNESMGLWKDTSTEVTALFDILEITDQVEICWSAGHSTVSSMSGTHRVQGSQ